MKNSRIYGHSYDNLYIWKNVDDYDFRDVNEQPGDDLPENVHEGNEYEYEERERKNINQFTCNSILFCYYQNTSIASMIV